MPQLSGQQGQQIRQIDLSTITHGRPLQQMRYVEAKQRSLRAVPEMQSTFPQEVLREAVCRLHWVQVINRWYLIC